MIHQAQEDIGQNGQEGHRRGSDLDLGIVAVVDALKEQLTESTGVDQRGNRGDGDGCDRRRYERRPE